MKEIFISYSSRESELAGKVCSLIESKGYNCFIASRDITPGHEYAAELVGAIDNCRLVVLLLSKNSNSSPHVLREIDRAVSHKKPIIVYQLEDVELNKSMEYFLMTHQWILNTPDKDERLLDGINKIIHPQAVSEAGPAVQTVDSNTPSGRKAKPLFFGIAAIAVIAAVLVIIFTVRNNKGGKSSDSGSPSVSGQTESNTPVGTQAPSAENNTDYKVADTITFGKYNDADIDWIILKINDNNTAVVVSEKILTFKAFDTAECGKWEAFESQDAAKKILANPNEAAKWRGNNDWSISNIRIWLNSSDSRVTFEDQAPTAGATYESNNAYSEESGFLHGFTEAQRDAIIPTVHPTMANPLNANAGGTIETTDLVFLLSEEELSWFDEAGVSKYAKVTEQAASANESSFYKGQIVDGYGSDTMLWWLRDPSPDSVGKGVLANFDKGGDSLTFKDYYVSCSDFGIRPAIVINLNSSEIIKK